MASPTIRVVTVFGIPISVDASWILIYALIAWSLAAGYFPNRLPGLEPAAYWASGLLAALLLFVSVLIHELAHSLVALRFGVAVRGITLHVLGGVSQLADEPPSPTAEAAIAVVGPLASFGIGAGLWLVRATDALGTPWANALVGYLILVNVAIGLFNLIPGFPLDGGRILRAAAWRSTGDLTRATAIASRVGGAVALALVTLGALQTLRGSLFNGLWLVVIGLFLHRAAGTSYSQTTIRAALGQLTVSDVMTREVVTVPETASVTDLVRHFRTQRVTSFPVVDGSVVRGVASVHDVGGIPAQDRERTSVHEVMRPLTDALIIAPTATALEALHRATGNGLGRLVVLDGHRLVGYLSIKDLTHVLSLRGTTASIEPAFAPHRPQRRAA